MSSRNGNGAGAWQDLPSALSGRDGRERLRTGLTAAAFDARLARAGLILPPGERAAVLELAGRLHRAAALVRTGAAARISSR